MTVQHYIRQLTVRSISGRTMPTEGLEFVFSEDTRYGYAVGRVRALEARLLGATDYERLVAAEQTEAVARTLMNCGYERWIDAEKPDLWASGLRRASEENRQRFLSLCLDEWLAQLVQLPDFFRDVRRRLKVVRNLPRGDHFSALLCREFQRLGWASLDAHVCRLVGNDAGSLTLDELLDELEFEAALALAPRRSFAAAFVRLRQANYHVFRRERETARREFMTSGQVDLGQADRLGLLERDLRVAEIGFLKRARFATFGFEPVMAFYYLVEHELRNISCLLLPADSVPARRRNLVAYA